MIQTKEDLTFAMEQLMYYHLNEDDGTIDDTMVLNLFVTGPQYDLWERERGKRGESE